MSPKYQFEALAKNQNRLVLNMFNDPKAYGQFYKFAQYSTRNRLFLFSQISDIGLKIGPVNTFQGWKKMGNYVSKGQKGLYLI